MMFGLMEDTMLGGHHDGFERIHELSGGFFIKWGYQ